MKLLFVHDHPFYSDNVNKVVYSGGGLPAGIWENYLMNFANVTVFGRRSVEKKDRRVVSSRQNVSFRLTGNYQSPLRLIGSYRKLQSELKHEISDANVILVRLPSVLGFVAGRLAKKMGKPLWVEQVGNAQDAFGTFGSFLGRVIAPFFQRINQNLVKHADFITYVTESQLQGIYPKGAHSVSVSLSNVKIMDSLSIDQLDKGRYDDSTLDIALIGGFDVRYKGQDVLLKAIEALPPEIKRHVRLHFIGKGDSSWVWEMALALGVSENIEYRAALSSGDEVDRYLRNISLYVQPSLTEGLPRATIEAMSVGCPVIGSNAGGIIELVSHRFVHDAGNSNELMAHILTLFNDRALLYREAQRSVSHVLPYLYSNLLRKRKLFYEQMNEILRKE